MNSVNPTTGKALFARVHLPLKVLFNAMLLALLMPVCAWAQFATSSGYGALVELEAQFASGNMEGLQAGPEPPVSGQGSSSYGPFQEVFTGLNERLPEGVSVATDILSGAAVYDASALTVQGDASVVDAVIDIAPPGLSALLVEVASMRSQSEISGSCGNLSVTASSSFADGLIYMGGITAIDIPGSPAPNTTIETSALGLAGISIVLNEQIISGDGIENLSVVTNAMRISLAIDTPMMELSGDMVFGSSSASLTGCAVSAGPEADVAVFKTAFPEPAAVGETLTYTIEVSNHGPNPANNVVVTDALALGFVAESITSDGGLECVDNAGVITCGLSEMAVGASGTIVIETRPQSTGVVINTAVVDSDNDDPDNSNNTSTAVTTIDDGTSTG